MSKQTAVEWLVDKLPHSIETQFKKQIDQAKAMSVIEHENTWNNAINAVEKNKWESFEDYYNRTYKGGEQ